MKELRIEARLRNNVLYQAIFSRYKSVAAFCQENDFSQGLVGSLLNLKHSPINRKGEFRPICVGLANFFKTLPEDLFPLHIYDLPNTKGTIEISFAELPDGGCELLQLPDSNSPFEEVLQKELQERIKKALSILTPREEKVIRMYYLDNDNMENTYEKISNEIGISGTRVGQILHKALRKLYCSPVKELLEDYVKIKDKKTGE